MTLEDYQLTLFDRTNIIKDTINKYGEQNFYLSFSGGKDSTILHYLLDMALPKNNIPRVFINTGIEYQAIVEFVKDLAIKDNRFIMLKPTQAIKPMLEKYGYPFKSKEHSLKISDFKKGSTAPNIIKYRKGGKFGCPKMLMYQYNKDFSIKLSNKCCYKLKKEPIHKWEKENNKTMAILGLRQSEGGQRANYNGCVIFDSKTKLLKKFKPLNPITDEWENWFIEKYNIQLCKLYYEPYNFKRTGCKGCPYSLELQNQLDAMEKYLPSEKIQCEFIWKPIYDEYRRLGYRLKKKGVTKQLNVFEEY